MKVLYLPLILFALLVLESVATEILPHQLLGDLFIIPHWVLVFSVLIILFYDRAHTYAGIFFGALFAFISELVYTDLLGVYLFAYGASLYLVHVIKKWLHANFLVSLLLVFYALFISEFLIYGIYFLIGVVDMQLIDYLTNRLVPTLIMNLIFFFVVYYSGTRALTRWRDDNRENKVA